VQPGDLGKPDIPAESDLLRLHRRKPSPLLLVQSAHEQVNPTVVLKVRMVVACATSGALAFVNSTVSHDGLLVRSPGTRIMVQKTWTLFVDGSLASLVDLWDNEADAVYDNWKELYGVKKR
jgi:hypothetical protein